MKLLIVLIVFIATNSVNAAVNTDSEYHIYVSKLTKRITDMKSKHGKMIGKLQIKENNLKQELQTAKQQVAVQLNSMKEQLIQIKLSEKEVSNAKITLKQYSNQIQRLKNKLKTKAVKSSITETRVNRRILNQLRKKKMSYEQIQLNMKEKVEQTKKIVKNMKKLQRKTLNKIFKIKRKIYHTQQKVKLEKKKFNKNLKRKLKILKEVNELASDKKRYAQQKSILESKIIVLNDQIKNAPKGKLPSLNYRLDTFKERVAFLTESIKDVVEREEEIFANSPQLNSLKEKLATQMKQIKADSQKLSQKLKDAKYQVQQAKQKLTQLYQKKANKEYIKEQKALINKSKEKVVEIKRKLSDISTKKDVVFASYKAKEKAFYNKKKLKQEESAFKRLSEDVKTLRGVFNRILRIKNAIKVHPTDKLKERLRIIEGKKTELLVRIRVVENRLVTYQKKRQQQIRVRRAELRMKKERLLARLRLLEKKVMAKKMLVDTTNDDDKIVNAKEYFLIVDKSSSMEKEIAKINAELNSLQLKEINMLRAVIKRMKVIVTIMGIKENNFEEKLGMEMAEFHKIIDDFVVQKYNLEMITRENELQAKELNGN